MKATTGKSKKLKEEFVSSFAKPTITGGDLYDRACNRYGKEQAKTGPKDPLYSGKILVRFG